MSNKSSRRPSPIRGLPAPPAESALPVAVQAEPVCQITLNEQECIAVWHGIQFFIREVLTRGQNVPVSAIYNSSDLLKRLEPIYLNLPIVKAEIAARQAAEQRALSNGQPSNGQPAGIPAI